jgi:hypothetical protein
MAEIFFTDARRNLVIQRSSSYSSDFVTFLEQTIWGSGGVKYTINNMAAILNRLDAPHFLSLTENGKLVAVSTLIKKNFTLAGESYPAFYSYGLAVDVPKRGYGYGALLSDQALHYGLSQMGEKGLFYGYVEASNTSSLRTVQKVGRKSIGQYHSLIISRLNPQDDGGMEQLEERSREQLVQLLGKQYEKHTLLDVDQAAKAEDYFILRRGNDIVAGVQCERNHLTVSHLPGAGGLFLLKVLPFIPILRNLIPQGNFHFLRFGNIYVSQGQETALFALMESVLAWHQLNFGMIFMDPRSPMYQRLNSVGRLGILHAMLDVPVHVMAYFKGFSEKETIDICRQPLFISIMDPV